MIPTAWIGADPGKTGGLVALNGDGLPVAWTLTPIEGRGTKTHERVDFRRLLKFLQIVEARTGAPPGATRLVVERVNSWPDDSPLTAFRFGETNQALHDLAAARGVSLETITPSVWQRAMLKAQGLPTDSYERRKASAVLACERRFRAAEEFLDVLGKKKNQGLADAALIAVAGKLRDRGVREKLAREATR